MKTLNELIFESYEPFFGGDRGVYAVYKGTLVMEKCKKSNREEV
jgi:hypothetical protein